MNKTTLTFTIPDVPGSVNSLYGITKFGRKYMRPQGKSFKELVHRKLESVQQIEDIFYGRLKIKFTIYFNTLRKRDLDNCMKILWDSLEHVLFDDDAQIDDYRVVRAYDALKPRVEVEVETII